MKVKYFVLSDNNSKSGVSKKVSSQLSALVQAGLNIELILVAVGNTHCGNLNNSKIYTLDKIPPKKIIRRIKRVRKINRILDDIIKELNYNDILYLRGLSPFILNYPHNYLRIFRICRIVTEHQTFEREEYKLGNNFLSYISDILFAKILRKNSDALVGVTDEITKYELVLSGNPDKLHITIGNGFDVNSVLLRKPPQFIDNEIHILCVANVSRWHGLDRLIMGLNNYNKNTNIYIHIVGDGSELSSLIKLTTEFALINNVVFHGFKTGDELDEFFNKCHIAVGSLGIHRIGLKEASILKAREYCARGIPYIIACDDPDFPKDFPYILRLPADESPIDINEVVAFAKRMSEDKQHPQKMHEYASVHLDWSVKMKKLKEFFEGLTETSK